MGYQNELPKEEPKPAAPPVKAPEATQTAPPPEVIASTTWVPLKLDPVQPTHSGVDPILDDSHKYKATWGLYNSEGGLRATMARVTHGQAPPQSPHVNDGMPKPDSHTEAGGNEKNEAPDFRKRIPGKGGQFVPGGKSPPGSSNPHDPVGLDGVEMAVGEAAVPSTIL